MTGFFLKKAFFDGWDNLIGLVVLNLGYLAILLAVLGCMTLAGISTPLALFAFLLTTGVFAFFSSGVAASSYSFARYERPGWTVFKQGIRGSWRHSLFFWLLILLDACLILFVIPFYLSYNNVIGMLLAVLLFWVFLGLTFALFYYWPLFFVMQGDRPTKTLKKSFIIVFDNLLFTFFFAIYQLFNLVISILLAGLAPGVAGMHLAASDAIKLLMFKYDYLEEHPDADRRHIPWEELLYEERECIGHRSLKNMIFPWKD